jgi:hypothetical protein
LRNSNVLTHKIKIFIDLLESAFRLESQFFIDLGTGSSVTKTGKASLRDAQRGRLALRTRRTRKHHRERVKLEILQQRVSQGKLKAPEEIGAAGARALVGHDGTR